MYNNIKLQICLFSSLPILREEFPKVSGRESKPGGALTTYSYDATQEVQYLVKLIEGLPELGVLYLFE